MNFNNFQGKKDYNDIIFSIPNQNLNDPGAIVDLNQNTTKASSLLDKITHFGKRAFFLILITIGIIATLCFSPVVVRFFYELAVKTWDLVGKLFH